VSQGATSVRNSAGAVGPSASPRDQRRQLSPTGHTSESPSLSIAITDRDRFEMVAICDIAHKITV
jgi:hypothetical protein